MILSEKEIEKRFKSLKIQKEEEKENDPTPNEIKEKLSLYFKSQMLPFYVEAFKNLSKYNLFDSARAMGKTTNVLYGILALSLEENRNILVLRKFANSNADSVHPEILEKIYNAFEYIDIEIDSSIIKIQKNKFIFFPNDNREKIVISLDGSYRPSSIKGKKGFSLILLEETADFQQEDFINAFPTFRDTRKEVLFFCLTNIPKEGKNHFIYYLFIKNPSQEYARFHPSWENNPAYFKTPKHWEKWVRENKPLFIGREKSFQREILGEWVESDFSFFKKIKILKEKDLHPNYWIYINQSSKPYWLGIYRKVGGGFIVLKEAFETPEEAKMSVVVIESRKEKKAIEKMAYWLKYVKPFSENQTANYFLYNNLEIEEDCFYAKNEAFKAEWEIKEGEGIVDRRLKNNIEGLFVYAIRFAVAFCG